MSAESRQILVIVLILTAIGLAFLFSASAVPSEAGRAADPYHFLKKQLLWAGLGAGAMAICWRIRLDFWRRFAPQLWAATLVMLALCFVPGIGAQINGAHRWLKAAGWFVQPSEVAKITLLMAVAAYAIDAERLRTFKRGFIPSFGMVLVTSGLIMVEPDLGTTAFVALIATTTLVVAGMRLLHLLPFGTAAAVAGGFYAATHPHVLARIFTFQNPDHDPMGKGLQIHQSLIALGSGGWFGEGIGRGQGKLWFLPEVRSDFILPLIGQELGFLGVSAIVLLFVALGVAGWRVSRRARTPFGALLSFGITLTIILQAAMNIAVVTASMPTKGIPLPFLSAGGSSLLLTMCGIGVLMRIADGPCFAPGGGATQGRESTGERAETCESSLPAAAREDTSSRALPSPSIS